MMKETGDNPRAQTAAPPDAPARDPAVGGAPEPEAIEQHVATAEELTAELAAARAKADENWDLLLRARAEIENLRRRQATELEKAHKYALDGFVRELLQVRDSLELGHDAAQEADADIGKLREGTELTLKLLSDVMSKFGVESVEPLNQPFDPELHQAMTMQPRSDVPPNTVVAVLQKGYTLNGRLVRPALVMVSSAG
jgi:molecular chaperone GrpE